jgi:Zinc finger, C2H2 type
MNMLSKRRELPKNNEISTCKVCGKNFTKNFSLTRHMLLHTGERPFSCSICSYGFIQKSDLLRHEATHKAEFNFHCLYCTKRFKTKKNLQCHMSTHKDDRPFKCPKCPKSFKLVRLLNFHLGNHQSFANFQCDQCEVIFSTKEILLAHIQEYHVQTEGNIALEPLDIKPDPEPMELEEYCGIDHENTVNIKKEFDAEEFDGTVLAQPIKIKLEPGLEESGGIIHEKAIEIKPEPIELPPLNLEPCEIEEITTIEDGEGMNYGERFYAPIIDHEMEFFGSLVKDFKQLNQHQKEEFKRKVRLMIDEMLE